MSVKHLVIINPVAGKKDRSEIITASALREANGAEVEAVPTNGPGDATRIVMDRLEKLADDDFLRIYACGGDGTISEVVTGIYRSGKGNCALGTVPIGSGNDFVKYFDAIPISRFRSFAEMMNAPYQDADVLVIQDGASDGMYVSLNIVSFGFDSAVAEGMNRYRRLPLVSGSGAYNMAIVSSLLTKRKHLFTVIADGEELPTPKQGYLFVIAGNGRYYGGGFKASPIGDIQDGLLDLVRIRTVSIPAFAALIGKFRQGRHLREMQKYASHQCCSSVRILTGGPANGNIDGEVVTLTDPTVTVVHNAVKLIIPEEK